jgi:predicted NUDIX family phosphoesterase
MGAFLDAAYAVLAREGRPMTAREITDAAQASGVLQSMGRTPSQTMKSKLSTDILRRKERSRFMRSSQGRFALRQWTSTVPEFVAPRYKRALFDESIVAIPAAVLRDYCPVNGLYRGRIDYRGLVGQSVVVRRSEAEVCAELIQLVSVFLVWHRGRLLTYKRTRRLPEERLHHFYSAIFGGHLNPEDMPTLFDFSDPQQARPWLERELREELQVPRSTALRFAYRGLLYDDTVAVSRQHLGIVFDVCLPDRPVTIGEGPMDVRIGERGFLVDPRFEDLQTVSGRLGDFENWSRLLIRSEVSS